MATCSCIQMKSLPLYIVLMIVCLLCDRTVPRPAGCKSAILKMGGALYTVRTYVRARMRVRKKLRVASDGGKAWISGSHWTR